MYTVTAAMRHLWGSALHIVLLHHTATWWHAWQFEHVHIHIHTNTSQSCQQPQQQHFQSTHYGIYHPAERWSPNRKHNAPSHRHGSPPYMHTYIHAAACRGSKHTPKAPLPQHNTNVCQTKAGTGVQACTPVSVVLGQVGCVHVIWDAVWLSRNQRKCAWWSTPGPNCPA